MPDASARISVILAHSVPGSFNHAVAETAVAQLRGNSHEVSFHDLYQEGFSPLLPGEEIAAGAELPSQIAAHCREIEGADGVIVVHPAWLAQVRESVDDCFPAER